MTVTVHTMTEKISKEKLLNKFSINITYRTKQHLDILHSHVMEILFMCLLVTTCLEWV